MLATKLAICGAFCASILLVCCTSSEPAKVEPSVAVAPTSTKEPTAPVVQPGAASPAAAFEAAKLAAGKSDWSALLALTHPQDRRLLLAQFVMMGGMSTMGNEARVQQFDALLAKHSVVADKKSTPLSIPDPSARDAALAAMFGGTKDDAALLGDLMAFAQSGGAPVLFEAGLTLEGVQESGDAAMGTTISSGGAKRPIAFKKLEGRWYLGFGPPR